MHATLYRTAQGNQNRAVIKALFKLAVLALVGLIAYYFFFGSEEDQQRARDVVSKVSDLGKELGGFLAEEKEKLDQADFSQAIEKIGDALERLETQEGADESEELSRLRQDRAELSREVQALEDNPSEAKLEQLKQRIWELETRTQRLAPSADAANR